MYKYEVSIATKIILVNISEKFPVLFCYDYTSVKWEAFFYESNKHMQPCVLNPEETDWEVAALAFQAYSQVKYRQVNQL